MNYHLIDSIRFLFFMLSFWSEVLENYFSILRTIIARVDYFNEILLLIYALSNIIYSSLLNISVHKNLIDSLNKVNVLEYFSNTTPKACDIFYLSSFSVIL